MMDRLALQQHLDATARDLAGHFSMLLLVHDHPALTTFGSGVLWIDILSGTVRHNGADIPPLSIVPWLQGWLRESLVTAHLAKSAPGDASLTADCIVTKYSGQRDPDVIWTKTSTQFIGFEAKVRCRIAVAGLVAEASERFSTEWPDPSAT
jgi:hypothetical protein